jgi:hypothetical protein
MENKITEIDKKESGFRWPVFFLVSLIIAVINIVLLYMFPGNIYSNIAFVFAVLFIFKLLEFTTVNLLICSVFYFILASVVVLVDSDNISRMFLENMSFYVAAFFILAFVNYVYEEKAEKKLDKRKKIYFYLSIAFVALYLFSVVFFSRVDIKVHFFNRFLADKYFKEVEVVQVDGRKVYNEMIYSVERPCQYYIIDDYFTVVEGWAADESDIRGSRIDYIAVYEGDKPGEGRFITKCDYGIERSDIGERFMDAGFTCKIESKSIDDGIRKLFVCFHSNKFGWKYEEIPVIVNNEGSFVFERVSGDIGEGKFAGSGLSEDGEGIIFDEGSGLLKSASFKVDIESGKDYLISFDIRRLRNLNNIVYFDFFGEGYDNSEQEFGLDSDDIWGDRYLKINRIINSGKVPDGDIYFRIFTYSEGSFKVNNLEIYEVKERK